MSHVRSETFSPATLPRLQTAQTPAELAHSEVDRVWYPNLLLDDKEVGLVSSVGTCQNQFH